MPHVSTLFAGVLAATFSFLSLASAPVKAEGTPVASSYSSRASVSQPPLTFVRNDGQWPGYVYFRTETGGASTWIGAGKLWYSFAREIGGQGNQFDEALEPLVRAGQTREVERLNISVTLEGARTPEPVGEGVLPGVANYFVGRDPQAWRTNVPTFSSVLLTGVYDGIDLRYYAVGDQLEYDFIVAPRADYHQIKLSYQGVTNIAVSATGDLEIQTAWNTVTEHHPVIYQEVDGRRVDVAGHFALSGKSGVSFELTGYDPDLPVVIDPAISYSTFIGGVGNDNSSGITIDGTGAMYIVGSTRSAEFPVTNGFDSTYNATDSIDAFVTKFSPDGQTLIFSTFLGGTGHDYGYGVALGPSNDVYISGYTRSINFPVTENASDTSYNGGAFDAFAVRLSSSGDSLRWASYLGGSSNDFSFGVAVDADGAAYVAGSTSSTDLPTLNAWDATENGFTDMFLLKLGAANGDLVYSTYLGGMANDFCLGVAVDSTNRAYITGYTESTNFPYMNALDSTLSGTLADIVIAKFGQLADTLLFSTFFGGTGADLARGIHFAKPSSVWVVGQSGSTNFPIPASYDNTYNGGAYDAVVMKFSSDGQTYSSGTFLGGTGDDIAYSVDLDSAGEAYVTGITTSGDFPTVNPFQGSYMTAGDAFISKLNPTVTSLVFSSYLGGQSADNAYSIAVKPSGTAYLTGETSSANFPKVNPYDGFFSGQFDGFVTVISFDSDGDGVEDAVDNCVNTPNPGQEDADGDLVGDACDNCAATVNPNQANADGDALGDACDLCPNDPNNDIDGDGLCGNTDNCPTTYNPLQEDSNNNGIGDICEQGYTTPGTNVAITYGGVTVTFPTVTSPGVTEIIIGPCSLPQPDTYTIQPPGAPICYEVKTTAGFTGTPIVCLNYNPAQISGSESTLKWLKYQSGTTWNNVTGAGYPNVTTNYICATTSLGTFALAQAGGCCVSPVGNVDCDPGNSVDVADLTALIDNLFIGFTPLCCVKEANVDGSPGIDVSDLTKLIDNLFISFTPLGACQ